ncbi:hypothetical protein [Alteromonas confluentis]|uniref:ParE family toxin-like protein n=1 Tax=Alteromonas confluentis TaxID=1656094 RepID=UPI003CCB7D7F
MHIQSVGYCPERIYRKARSLLMTPLSERRQCRKLRAVGACRSYRLPNGFRLLCQRDGNALILSHDNYIKMIKNSRNHKDMK